MNSPFAWFGGKHFMINKILPLIPKHKTYVEVFGGAACLLFAKDPSISQLEIYNDIDHGLVDFFRVLRDPIKFSKLLHKLKFTPYSREEFCECRETWRNFERGSVEKAYCWYICAIMGFGGRFEDSWGFGVASHSCAIKFANKIKDFKKFHKRITKVQVENLDFRKCFQIYDTPETFFYVDPPYIPDTRKAGEYEKELTVDDHKELINILLNLQGSAILSGYNHEIMKPLEQAGWIRQDYEMPCMCVGRTKGTGLKGEGKVKDNQMRTESLWISPFVLERLPAQFVFSF